MNNNAVGSDWDAVRTELFTPEEIAASDARVALIGAQIESRREKERRRNERSTSDRVVRGRSAVPIGAAP